MKVFDTIAAIATPVGTGGIAIIRISGEDAVSFAEKIIFPKSGRPFSTVESHKLVLSQVRRLSDGLVLDEVLAAVMRGPHSYTGEDVVEINCHGGYLAAETILNEVFGCGARLAEAGEFTRRAFMNGKMDLLKAESVIDLINSNSKLGYENAAKTLSGKLSDKVGALREEAVALAANLSAIADYPEEMDELSPSGLFEAVDSLLNGINLILGGFEKGRIMRDGVQTVIAGRPNVGKSSLLNAISRTDRAIVTDMPGTTRDTVEEYVTVKGIALRLIDTAGIRESENTVEQIGVKRAIENIEKSELCLFVLDASQEITDEDMQIFEHTRDKAVIIILNKTDKAANCEISYYAQKLGINEDCIVCTATPMGQSPQGIGILEDRIARMLIDDNISKDDVFISNSRQKNALIKARQIAEGMKESLRLGMPTDMLYIDLEELILALGEVTGVTVQDEIIEQVFERFCVGK